MEKTQRDSHSRTKTQNTRSGDPKTAFGRMSPAEIIEKHGLPRFLTGLIAKDGEKPQHRRPGKGALSHARSLLFPRDAGAWSVPRPLQRTDADAHPRTRSRPPNRTLRGETATLPSNTDRRTKPT